jgi:hypothetical protein
MENDWEERLLGFDARVAVAAAWPDERRDAYLLRPEVAHPCSTDPQAWPSLFDQPGLARPSYVGFFQDLWEDLEQLREAVAAAKAPDATLVAVTVQARQTGWTGRSPLAPVLGGRIFDAFSGLPLPLPYARPTSRDASWPLLGYDVADIYGLSGLASCRRETEAERDALRATFGARLNRHHLFESPDDADEFRQLCDARVAEHAPFFIYGLWSPTA